MTVPRLEALGYYEKCLLRCVLFQGNINGYVKIDASFELFRHVAMNLKMEISWLEATHRCTPSDATRVCFISLVHPSRSNFVLNCGC